MSSRRGRNTHNALLCTTLRYMAHAFLADSEVFFLRDPRAFAEVNVDDQAEADPPPDGFT